MRVFPELFNFMNAAKIRKNVCHLEIGKNKLEILARKNKNQLQESKNHKLQQVEIRIEICDFNIACNLLFTRYFHLFSRCQLNVPNMNAVFHFVGYFGKSLSGNCVAVGSNRCTFITTFADALHNWYLSQQW